MINTFIWPLERLLAGLCLLYYINDLILFLFVQSNFSKRHLWRNTISQGRTPAEWRTIKLPRPLYEHESQRRGSSYNLSSASDIFVQSCPQLCVFILPKLRGSLDTINLFISFITLFRHFLCFV